MAPDDTLGSTPHLVHANLPNLNLLTTLAVSLGGGCLHHPDELLQVNLAVTVHVAQVKDSVNLLLIEIASLDHLLLGHLPVAVEVHLLEDGLHILDSLELILNPGNQGGRTRAHNIYELLKIGIS